MMLLEQRLIELEHRAVASLAGLCPRITRRTAQFVPPGIGATLDISAKARSEEFGSAVLGQATVEFWLTAAARHPDSSMAQDWAQLTLGYAREKLSASTNEIPELSQLRRVDYAIVANNQAGDEWLHVYRAIHELRLQTRAGGAAISAINSNTVTDGLAANALATSARPVLFINSTLELVGAEIAVIWANALQSDEIELFDADGSVVATHTVPADGAGSFRFANTTPGHFGARLQRAGTVLDISLSTAARVAQQG